MPFVLSVISLIHVLDISEYKFFNGLIRFIPRYFVLSDAIVSVIVLFGSLSDSSLLVYRKKHFCILILYIETLLNLVISSNSLGCTFRAFYIFFFMSFTDAGLT